MRYKTKLLGTTFMVMAALCSCSRRTDIPYIDLTGIDDSECEVSSEELFSSIRYVPLETNDSCLLRNPSVFAIDEDNVLIWDEEIMRFSIDGKFLNRIGKRGNGHGEHGMIISANYNGAKKEVYIGTPGGVIYRYGLEGDYIGRMTVADRNEALQTVRFSEPLGGLVCEMRRYTNQGLDVSLKTVTLDNEVKSSYTVYSDNRHVDTNFFKSGMLRDYCNGVLFMLPFDDRVFLLTEDSVSEYMVLDRGDYSPDREMVEDCAHIEELERTKYIIDNMVMTLEHLYLQVSCDQGCRKVLVNRSFGKVIHNRYYRDSEKHSQIRLDDFADVTFWPWVSSEGWLVDLLPVEDFSADDLETLREHSCNNYLQGNLSNPVLIMAKERL